MDANESMAKARAAVGKRDSTGRPLGSCNLGAKALSGLARSFKGHGFDWRLDFATSIKARDYKLMSFYLKLLPHLTTQNPGYRKNAATMGYTKKQTSKAKLEGLAAQEQALREKNPGGLNGTI